MCTQLEWVAPQPPWLINSACAKIAEGDEKNGDRINPWKSYNIMNKQYIPGQKRMHRLIYIYVYVHTYCIHNIYIWHEITWQVSEQWTTYIDYAQLERFHITPFWPTTIWGWVQLPVRSLVDRRYTEQVLPQTHPIPNQLPVFPNMLVVIQLRF